MSLQTKLCEVTIDTNDQLFDAQSFRNVIVAYRNGAPVKVSDVAQVIDSSELPRTGAWFNGKQCELLLIRRQAGANTLAVVDQIKSMMPTLLASFPPSIHVELNHWAPIIQQQMQQVPELQDVASDQQIASPHVAVEIDRNAASRLGLSLSLIDQTLYDAFGQRQIGTIYTSAQQYKLILEVAPQFQNDVSALSRIYVTSNNGSRVPLTAVAHMTSKVEPLTINRQGQFPAVTLSFNVAPGFSLGQAVERIQSIERDLKTPITLQGSFQGTAQAFQTSLTSTPILVMAAILVVYIVLGMLYESYIHPITILSALPSAGVGALVMLMLFRGGRRERPWEIRRAAAE